MSILMENAITGLEVQTHLCRSLFGDLSMYFQLQSLLARPLRRAIPSSRAILQNVIGYNNNPLQLQYVGTRGQTKKESICGIESNGVQVAMMPN